MNPTPVNMRNCQNFNIYLSMNVKVLQKKCGPQIMLCLCMFRPITLKQFKSLTAIKTVRCLDGPAVTLQTAVPGLPGIIPGPCKNFYVCYILQLYCCCCCCCCVFTFFVRNTLFVIKNAIHFAMLIH